jgi:hypothetical protein
MESYFWGTLLNFRINWSLDCNFLDYGNTSSLADGYKSFGENCYFHIQNPPPDCNLRFRVILCIRWREHGWTRAYKVRNISSRGCMQVGMNIREQEIRMFRKDPHVTQVRMAFWRGNLVQVPEDINLREAEWKNLNYFNWKHVQFSDWILYL